MICKIADLITEIPAAGDLVLRCKDYLHQGTENVDIVIDSDIVHSERYAGMRIEGRVYMESARRFYMKLLEHNGFYLHASAVELDGKAYLFSASSGVGKSTHTRLWQSVFGKNARVFNDDKPALRFLDGKWYAYGTPWCGKDGININMKVPVAGICFMKQARENRIRRLSQLEAAQKIIAQTLRRFELEESLDRMLSHVDNLVKTIPVYELENRPEPEAALLSHETMHRGAEEMGL